MRLVTIGSLGASAALGLGALIVAKVLMPAAAGNQAQAAPIIVSPLANGVEVVVASNDIAFGHRLEAGDLKLIKVPRDAAPEGAFTSIGLVLAQDHGGAPVALAPIAAREALLPTRLSGPGARQSVAAEIAPGMRAYAIAVNEVSSVGGHALPGDRVDVVLLRNTSTDDAKKAMRSDVVIQNVRLLGMGLNADPTSNKPESAATATLEVSMRDAQKLAIAADLGALSLALRPSGLAEVEPAPAVAGAEFTVGGSAAPRRAARGPAPGSAHILVVEGEGARPAPKS
jgi:pilus assembly protein CpaB